MNNPYDDKRVVVDAIGGKNEPLLFGEQGGGGESQGVRKGLWIKRWTRVKRESSVSIIQSLLALLGL